MLKLAQKLTALISEGSFVDAQKIKKKFPELYKTSHE